MSPILLIMLSSTTTTAVAFSPPPPPVTTTTSTRALVPRRRPLRFVRRSRVVVTNATASTMSYASVQYHRFLDFLEAEATLMTTTTSRIVGNVRSLRKRFYERLVWKKKTTVTTMTPQQREVLEKLKQQISPGLSRAAKRSGMPLTDDALIRYLTVADWKLRFPDRSVLAAIEDTVRWREKKLKAAKRDHKLEKCLKVIDGVKSRQDGSKVVAFRCDQAPRKMAAAIWQGHFVHTVESAVSGGVPVSVVVDCLNCTAVRVIEAARAASPAFPAIRTHYPGHLTKVFVVGSGKPLATAWWVVKKFLDERTCSKICFIPDFRRLDPLLHARGGSSVAALI